MNFKKYHVSKNLWNYQPDITSVGVTIHWDGEKLVFANTCTSSNNLSFNYGALPAGTYTLKANANHVPVNNLNVCIDLYQPSPFVQRKINNNEAVNGTVTFTLTEALTDARLRIRLEGDVNYDGFTLAPMLNSGDSSLPYEPYSSEVWHDIPYYQHKTATDTLTLPAVIYPNDTSITVGIKGQSSQNGTSNPQNPVDVNGTGERTGNLWDGNYENGVLNTDGTLNAPNYNYNTTMYIPTEEKNYTLSVVCNYNEGLRLLRVCFYDENKNFISCINSSGFQGESYFYEFNFTAPVNSKYLRFSYIFRAGVFDTNIMLNLGSEALSYEPYGIKIPILTNSTTNNVYLGEVQTVRQIKKYKFTGQETFSRTISSTETGTSVYSIRYDAIGMENIIDYNQLMPHITYPFFFCSHFVMKTNTSFDTPYTAIKNGEIGANSVANNTYNRYVIFASNQYNTVDTFQAFLAQQYANGTPVTVWYVLATPETAVVNEPLMKIGSYSDSLTTSIPVTAGENSLDVQTTVAPSEVAAGFSGWHAVSAAHERENGQWD